MNNIHRHTGFVIPQHPAPGRRGGDPRANARARIRPYRPGVRQFASKPPVLMRRQRS
jgi:hypothetical protein